MKFKNPASRYAIVGVFVADSGSGVRVAVTGAAPSVFREAAMEKALAAKFAPESVANIADRKSTRLNSSHLVISYAVFCLKKTRPEAAGAHQLESEDPVSGEPKGEERQAELEDAARADA